jgi:Uma2 family endonuclease
MQTRQVELPGGQLVVREAQGDPHAFAIELAHEALRTAFGPQWRVRVMLPIALDEESEPEPDISVVPGPLPDGAKPSCLALVVEIATSGVALEREFKGSFYARGRVPEYWIVNLHGRVLEVYREPAPDDSALYGWAYRSRQNLSAGEHVTLFAAPSARIAVADLLP